MAVKTPVLNGEKLLKLYGDMYMIRRFEEVVEIYAANGTIPGFVHLSIGQEACQAGTADVLRKTDYKFPDHRGHGTIALLGSDPKRVMAEIFGKATGINGGRGGSMHISDLEVRNMGNNGIQGSVVGTALGTAFTAKYRKTDDVTVVFMGDGTLGEGICHESINLAAVWKLPLVYLLVNNHYAISTHYTETHAQAKLKTWAEGYAVPSVRIDGNNVEEVRATVNQAVEYARAGSGPMLIEMMTYRWQGHFAGDPAAYRPEKEVAEWKAKDPLKKTRNDLIKRGNATEKELEKIEGQIEKEVQEMLKFSLESPAPAPEDAITHVYADREVEA
jgi:pyruvate dehydrogenase E1 component alpha subunit